LILPPGNQSKPPRRLDDAFEYCQHAIEEEKAVEILNKTDPNMNSGYRGHL
jgi:hypothetical protein